jgi:Spy/CpxP family protein refolding chaperone
MRMKLKSLLVALVLLLAGASALAQAPSAHPSSPDVPFMGNWNPPAAFSTDWWNDPEIATELRLTDAQKKQLEQVSTNLKLTLIDAGATGLKSYVRLQSLLDSDPFDRNSFNQELDAASSAASRLVKDFGQMAVSIRTTLTPEQWHKLEALKAAGRMRAHPRPGMGPDHRPRSAPPPSLQAPPQ